MRIVAEVLKNIPVIVGGIAALVCATPAALLLAVWHLLAFAVRLVASCHRATRQCASWPELVRRHPELGWQMAPNLDCYASPHAFDPFLVQTCTEGWPGRGNIADSNVVVVGDSFAAGNGVDAHRTYYNLDRTGLRIKPVACSGYSLVHGAMLFEHLAKSPLHGKLLVWLVCIENDFTDMFDPHLNGTAGPFLRRTTAGWEIVIDHLHERRDMSWSASVLNPDVFSRNFFNLYRDCYFADRAFSAAAYLLKRAVTAVKAAGGSIALFAIPPMPTLLPRWALRRWLAMLGLPEIDVGVVDARLQRICGNAGIVYGAGLRELRFRDFLLVAENHWNERGHRKFADWIAKTYEDKGS